MQLCSTYTARRFLILFIGVTLAGCVSSPLPDDAVAALYRWDDTENAVATRQSASALWFNGQFAGDFDFTEIESEAAALEIDPGAPLLIEACSDERCLRAVVFSEDFDRNDEGLVIGHMAISPLSTAMANEVAGLPAASVRPALDTLSARVVADGAADYAAFVSLQLEGAGREQLATPTLNETAALRLAEQPLMTLDELLSGSPGRTEALATTADFNFESSQVLAVDVDIPAYREDNAYMLLCSDFQASSATAYDVNYNACLLRTNLSGGRYSGDLKLTGGTERLVAVVIPLASPNQAQYQEWRRATDGNRLELHW